MKEIGMAKVIYLDRSLQPFDGTLMPDDVMKWHFSELFPNDEFICFPKIGSNVETLYGRSSVQQWLQYVRLRPVAIAVHQLF